MIGGKAFDVLEITACDEGELEFEGRSNDESGDRVRHTSFGQPCCCRRPSAFRPAEPHRLPTLRAWARGGIPAWSLDRA